jgi:hypothetical protein
MTDNGPGVVTVRAARPDEVEAVLGIQQAASVAGLGISSRRRGTRFRLGWCVSDGGPRLALPRFVSLSPNARGCSWGWWSSPPSVWTDCLCFLAPGAAGWLTDCTTRPSRRCVRGAVAAAVYRSLRRTIGPAASTSVVVGGWMVGGRAPRSHRTRRWSATPSRWALLQQQGRLQAPRPLIERRQQTDRPVRRGSGVGGRDRTRTCDLVVVSDTRYHCATRP